MTSEKYPVLLVEDEPIVRKVHKLFLEKIGLEVDLAENGMQALSKSDNHYSLIFMDMGLPDISGAEVITEIRKRELGKQHTPIIMLTGYVQEEIKQQSLAAGADEVAIKPIKLEEFKKILERYLEVA